jgi:hypothetical protein
MPISITSTGVQFSSGTQPSAGKIITFDYVEYGVRQSTPTQTGNTDLWTANQFTRKRTDTLIRVKGWLPGDDAFSYPYGGTYVRLTSPGGTNYYTYGASHYQSNYEGQIHIHWFADYTWLPGDIVAQTGTWTVRYGYGSQSGNGNRPWEDVWNPNVNDDSRALQTFSVSIVEEILQ